MKKITGSMIKACIKHRDSSSHKGDYGHALLISGSKGCMGAAVISARACLRTGSGLLTVNVPQEERFALQGIPEAMLQMRENVECDFTKYSAIGIGPGIGITKDSEKLVKKLIAEFNKPYVLDADALNIISANRQLLSKITGGAILTPHPKEFDRLFGMHKNVNERMSTAIRKAQQYNIVIVLKGHNTLVTFAGEAFLNTTGNAGLAKGGSGDALTGIITSFLAQGYEPFIAAKLGVYFHGLAADIALKSQSMESMLITDVIECFGQAFKQIIR